VTVTDVLQNCAEVIADVSVVTATCLQTGHSDVNVVSGNQF
jgi:hypothetical protein